MESYRNSPVMHERVPDQYKPVIFHGGLCTPFSRLTKTKKIKDQVCRQVGFRRTKCMLQRATMRPHEACIVLAFTEQGRFDTSQSFPAPKPLPSRTESPIA